MTGATHRAYAVTFALGGAAAVNIFGLSDINPLVLAVLMRTSGQVGAVFPDIDHAWNSVPGSLKSIPGRVINVLIRATGGKHRAWHTHSLDVWAALTAAIVFLPLPPVFTEAVGATTIAALYALVFGFMAGWLSHLFADMLTPSGIQILCFLKKFKLRLVPKWAMFATNSKWEDMNFKFINAVNAVAGIVFVGWAVYQSGWLDGLRGSLAHLIN
jgi:membrane-bound metal-dependent hydrolase YbcI (DUF457 family)